MKKESIVKLLKQPNFILENIKNLSSHRDKKKSIKLLWKKFAHLHPMQ